MNVCVVVRKTATALNSTARMTVELFIHFCKINSTPTSCTVSLSVFTKISLSVNTLKDSHGGSCLTTVMPLVALYNASYVAE
jgi:hypothetical protein